MVPVKHTGGIAFIFWENIMRAGQRRSAIVLFYRRLGLHVARSQTLLLDRAVYLFKVPSYAVLPSKMAPKAKSAAWSHVKVQQAVDALSAAAGDLSQQQSGKIKELTDYLQSSVPTPAAFADMLRQTPVLRVLLSVVTARMQQQDLRRDELPLFGRSA